jgi:hypothetical protein
VPVLSIPPVVDPDTVQFWSWANSFTSVSPLTRDQQTVVYPGVLWRARFEWPVLQVADWRLVAAWLAELQGAGGRFNLSPPHARFPQGQDAPDESFFDDDTGFTDGYGFFDPPAEVLIRGDVASSKILFRTEGWASSQTVLKRGDYISWSNRTRRMMAILARDARSDSLGNADLQLAFPAPEIPLAGRRLYPWWVSVTMRLLDDEQAQQSFQNYLQSQQAFEAVEASPF